MFKIFHSVFLEINNLNWESPQKLIKQNLRHFQESFTKALLKKTDKIKNSRKSTKSD